METKCLYSSSLPEKPLVLIGLYGGSSFSKQENNNSFLPSTKEVQTCISSPLGGRKSLYVFKGPLQGCWQCLCLSIKASHSALQKLSMQVVEEPDLPGHGESK